jgi:hypothetical protein
MWNLFKKSKKVESPKFKLGDEVIVPEKGITYGFITNIYYLHNTFYYDVQAECETTQVQECYIKKRYPKFNVGTHVIFTHPVYKITEVKKGDNNEWLYRLDTDEWFNENNFIQIQ